MTVLLQFSRVMFSCKQISVQAVGHNAQRFGKRTQHSLVLHVTEVLKIVHQKDHLKPTAFIFSEFLFVFSLLFF